MSVPRLFALNPTRTRHPVYDHMFEIATMVCFLLIGITLLVWPDAALRSPVGRELMGFQYVWALMYVIGCPSSLFGLYAGSDRWRVAGKTMAGTGMFMQGIAALTGDNVDLRALSYFSFGAACYARAFVVGRMAQEGAK